MAVIEPTDAGLVVREIAPDTTIADVKEATAAELIVPAEIPQMRGAA
jgi:acetate CoA/acetoacetate CoA-transferase beta subunit